MKWYVMAASVPEGTQITAVESPTRPIAVRHAANEIRKHYGLPASHTIMPRVIEVVDTEEDAKAFIDLLHIRIKEEELNNAQA